VGTNKYYNAQEHTGICVTKREDESIDDLIRRFRKKCSKSGISKELRERMYFEKPSKKRRRKKAQSIRMIQREEIKMQNMKEKVVKQKLKRRRLERDDRGSQRQNRVRKTYKNEE